MAAGPPEIRSSGTVVAVRIRAEAGWSPAAACVSGLSDDHEDAIDANVKFRKCQKQTLSRAGSREASGACQACHPSAGSREAAAAAESTCVEINQCVGCARYKRAVNLISAQESTP